MVRKKGQIKMEIKKLLKQREVGEKLYARDLARLINKDTDLNVSSIFVAQMLSQLGCVEKCKERDNVADSFQWEVKPKVVLL